MQTIRIEDIKVGPRLRYVDVKDEQYKQLREAIKATGLHTPIVLLKPTPGRLPRLVAGLHRLTALRELGTKMLREGREFVWLDVEGLNAREIVIRCQIVEASENLDRVPLNSRMNRKFHDRALRAVVRAALERRRKEQAERVAVKKEADARAAEARKALKKKQDEEAFRAAEEAERERSRAAAAVKHGAKTLELLSLGAQAKRVTKLPNGVAEEVAKVTGVTVHRIKQVRQLSESLASFIEMADLERHPICAKIDAKAGEFVVLETLALPPSKAFHAGLRQWCDRVRARQSVESPSELREKIKRENAQAREAEARADARKGKAEVAKRIADVYSATVKLVFDLKALAKDSPHPAVKEMIQKELPSLEKLKEAASSIQSRTVARNKAS